jgi:hypothetical protein
LAEEITIGTVIHDDERAIFLLNDAMECHDIRVGRCTFVESDLLDVKTSLAGGVPRRCVKKAFDGVGWGIECRRTKVDRAINDTVAAITQDAYEFEGAIVDDSADSGGTRKVVGRHIAEQDLQDLQEMSLEERGGEGDGSLPASGETVEESGE